MDGTVAAPWVQAAVGQASTRLSHTASLAGGWDTEDGREHQALGGRRSTCELRGCGQKPHPPFTAVWCEPGKAGHSSLACVALHRRKESGTALEQPTGAQGVVLWVASTLAGRRTLEERPSKP